MADTVVRKEGHFDTKSHAEAYKVYRSELPNQIIQKIAAFLNESFQSSECVGIDVGCGSGQSTIPLASILKTVIGIDTSVAQLEEIKEKPYNVIFKKGSAEHMPVPTNTVHLVTAVNAAHWFDLEKFYQEVDRVLVPNGIVALIRGSPCIELKGAESRTTQLFHKLKSDTAEYWDYGSRVNDYLYKNFDLPFRMKIRDESLITEETLTISFVIGRVRTFSGIAKMIREHPVKANKVLEKFQSDLMDAVGHPNCSPDKVEVVLKRQFVLLMGRKPAAVEK